MIKDSLYFIKKKRILFSRILVVLITAIFIFTDHSWKDEFYHFILFQAIGGFLVGFCILGRLWSALYIAGNKTKTLISEGPYSMVRNPLYFFSFFGAIGLGLTTENLLILLLIVVLFIIYYPFVIIGEEKRLIEVHGDEFLAYMKHVPRFIPNPFKFKEPEFYNVNVKKYKIAFVDAMGFFSIYICVQIVNILHAAKVIPAYFSIPKCFFS
jgi:protein-S-isoprenylcysteine O-methyltransferase Ste14